MVAGGNGFLGSQQLPQVTTLSDGRFAVVYQSDYDGSATTRKLIAAIYNADGGASSITYLDVFNQAAIKLNRQSRAATWRRVWRRVHKYELMLTTPSTQTRTTSLTCGLRRTARSARRWRSAISILATALTTCSTRRSPRCRTAARSWRSSGFSPQVTDDDILLNVVNADGLTTQFNAFGSNPALATGRLHHRLRVQPQGGRDRNNTP